MLLLFYTTQCADCVKLITYIDQNLIVPENSMITLDMSAAQIAEVVSDNVTQVPCIMEIDINTNKIITKVDGIPSCFKLLTSKFEQSSPQQPNYQPPPPQQQRENYQPPPPQHQSNYQPPPPQHQSNYQPPPPQHQSNYQPPPPQQQPNYQPPPPQQQRENYQPPPPQHQPNYQPPPPQHQPNYQPPPPQHQSNYQPPPPQQQPNYQPPPPQQQPNYQPPPPQHQPPKALTAIEKKQKEINDTVASMQNQRNQMAATNEKEKFNSIFHRKTTSLDNLYV